MKSLLFTVSAAAALVDGNFRTAVAPISAASYRGGYATYGGYSRAGFSYSPMIASSRRCYTMGAVSPVRTLSYTYACHPAVTAGLRVPVYPTMYPQVVLTQGPATVRLPVPLVWSTTPVLAAPATVAATSAKVDPAVVAPGLTAIGAIPATATAAAPVTAPVAAPVTAPVATPVAAKPVVTVPTLEVPAVPSVAGKKTSSAKHALPVGPVVPGKDDAPVKSDEIKTPPASPVSRLRSLATKRNMIIAGEVATGVVALAAADAMLGTGVASAIAGAAGTAATTGYGYAAAIPGAIGTAASTAGGYVAAIPVVGPLAATAGGYVAAIPGAIAGAAGTAGNWVMSFLPAAGTVAGDAAAAAAATAATAATVM